MSRLGKALRNSWDGIAAAWRHEASFREEAVAAAVLFPLAFLVPVPWTQRALLAAAVLLVLVVELINSSIEAAVDRISLELHPLSKRAKDAGSAAVLLSLAIAALLWGAILGSWLLGVP